MIHASCGCQVPEGERSIPVVYRTQDCDAVDGFYDAVCFASFCRKCAALLVLEDRFISAGMLANEFTLSLDDISRGIQESMGRELARRQPNKAKGGYARAAKLSPERRREIALKANAARWGKQA